MSMKKKKEEKIRRSYCNQLPRTSSAINPHPNLRHIWVTSVDVQRVFWEAILL